MKKKRIITAFVLALIGYFLIESWITILEKSYVVQWQHLTGLLFYVPLPILLFRHYKAAVLGTGIYLVIGLFRALSLTSAISTTSVTIAGLTISGFNDLSLGLLVLFLILHVDILIEMQLDYKESQAKLKQP